MKNGQGTIYFSSVKHKVLDFIEEKERSPKPPPTAKRKRAVKTFVLNFKKTCILTKIIQGV